MRRPLRRGWFRLALSFCVVLVRVGLVGWLVHVHDEWNAETGQNRHCSVDNPHYPCEITRPLAPDRHTDETEHVDNRSETHRQRAQE